MRNKFDILTDQISGNVDVMVISETKLDDSFPESQLKNRVQNGEGIMVFARVDITAKLLSFEDKLIEALFIELFFNEQLSQIFEIYFL